MKWPMKPQPQPKQQREWKKNATIWKRLRRSSSLVAGLPMPAPPSRAWSRLLHSRWGSSFFVHRQARSYSYSSYAALFPTAVVLLSPTSEAGLLLWSFLQLGSDPDNEDETAAWLSDQRRIVGEGKEAKRKRAAWASSVPPDHRHRQSSFVFFPCRSGRRYWGATVPGPKILLPSFGYFWTSI
jgi:hypothetical protein